MSKQSEAKKRQGYDDDPMIRKCSSCAHYRFDRESVKFLDAVVDTTTNLRCGLGGFKVSCYGTCNEWKAKSC